MAGGTVTGVIWFDRNQDGDRDPGEWPLPGVTVTLAPADPTGAARVSTRQIRAAATVRRAVTAADGSYTFPDVAPGGYTASASVSVPGFSYTSDSDGSADWSVSIDTGGTGTGQADFAGTGRGSLGGTIYDDTTGDPIAGADVTCRWAGLDDTMDTADDVRMVLDAGGSGAFTLTQLPYGRYECSGSDPETGATSRTAAVSVMSATPARVALPIGDRDDDRLPTTGTPATRMLALGVAFLLAGAAAVALARRRPARTSRRHGAR